MTFSRWLGLHRLHYRSLLPNRSQKDAASLKNESEALELTLSEGSTLQDRTETEQLGKKIPWDWRSNVKLALAISIIILIANFALLIVGISIRGQEGGIGTLHEGRVKKISRITTAYHIFINILSTGLLTSSNYCMQLVCAPTRDDMDRIHDRGDYLDIGILSFRNVRRIPRRRALLWLVLAASSIPLHLFYNSSIFSVTVGRDYEIGFLNSSNTHQIENYTSSCERLDNSAWMSKYDTKYVPEYGNLYLVLDRVSFEFEFDLDDLTWKLVKPRNGTDSTWEVMEVSSDEEWTFDAAALSLNASSTGTSGSILRISSYKRRQVPMEEYSSQTMPTLDWPESLHFRVSDNSSWKDVLSLNPDAWMYPPYHVGYGLAEVHKGSAVQISSAFLAVVVACNVLKSIAIYYTLRGSYSSQIITQGDAISTYLEYPDPRTLGFCAIDKRSLTEIFRAPSRSDKRHAVEPWEYRKARYSDFAQGRWTSYMTLGILIAVSIVGVVLLSTQNLSAWGTASKHQIQFFVSPLDTRGIILTS